MVSPSAHRCLIINAGTLKEGQQVSVFCAVPTVKKKQASGQEAGGGERRETPRCLSQPPSGSLLPVASAIRETK